MFGIKHADDHYILNSSPYERVEGDPSSMVVGAPDHRRRRWSGVEALLI